MSEQIQTCDVLSEREQKALMRFREDRAVGRDYPLAPITSAKLFALFVTGKSCEEIQALNSNFSLGQVVDACVEGRWEAKRRNHLNRLLSRVRERVLQVQSEGVEFLADLLAAAHKQHGDRLKKFLQTGDEKDLGPLSIDSLEQYRKAADVLLKLTGQAGQQKVAGEVVHSHVLQQPVVQLVEGTLAQLAQAKKGGS